MGLGTLTTERNETEVPLELLVNDSGGVTGLTVVVAIRDGASTTSWLDFSDNTFKAAGWTTRQAAVAQVSAGNAPGQYRRLLDLSVITNLPVATDFLVAEYDVTGTTTQNAQDIIQIVESYRNIPADTDTTLTASHGAGAWTTSTLSATTIATAVWTEPVPGAFIAGSAGFILGTNLDTTVSSRSSHSAAAASTAVWGETLPGAFGAGTAGNIVGNNLDATITSRSSHSAANAAFAVWDENIVAAHGAANTAGLLVRALGATISQRANNATLDLLLGISDVATRDLPEQVDIELTAAHGAGTWTSSGLSAAAIATAVWTEAIPGAFLAGSAGFILGTNLDTTISSRSSHSAAAAATAVWGESVPGAFGAGTAGFVLGTNLDAAVTTRSSHSAADAAVAVWDENVVAAHGTASTAGLLLRVLGASISTRANNATLDALLGVGDAAARDMPEQVDIELTATHGAGAWDGTSSDWTTAEREQIRFRLALDGIQTGPTTNTGTLEDILTSLIAADLAATVGSTVTEIRTGATQADGFYDEMTLLVVNILGVSTRRISGYLNANGAFTVTPALPFTPAVSDRVVILGRLASASNTAAIAAAVWDEPIAGHLAAGITGASLDNASTQAGIAVALTASK